ncbi:hypothetical protein [Emticicia sp. C21]|uniref:hypothetical protein n=1 Tax=Emticicia sp. C21 TaxID=2302915 RepID=UPI000E344116|nr:hypothetical protein [Emticicia sp. C21]RFS16257.1 hypothetical protein D0T08_11245 [Emticicia sp. C21]
MIRFLLDFQTTDILVITEKSVEKVDFYYIADFLKIERNSENNYRLSVKEIFHELLKHWKSVVMSDSSEIFIVYDLSDQYISAFCIEKFNFKGRMYTKITKTHTQQICGCNITTDMTNEDLQKIEWEKDENFLLQYDIKNIIKGIDWSIENLKINTNPIDIG